MSNDAAYLLAYDVQPYVQPSPMRKDKEYLMEEHGGEVIELHHGYLLYWEKPKYLLIPDEIKNLLADQIFERQDSEGFWKKIK